MPDCWRGKSPRRARGSFAALQRWGTPSGLVRLQSTCMRLMQHCTAWAPDPPHTPTHQPLPPVPRCRRPADLFALRQAAEAEDALDLQASAACLRIPAACRQCSASRFLLHTPAALAACGRAQLPLGRLSLGRLHASPPMLRPCRSTPSLAGLPPTPSPILTRWVGGTGFLAPPLEQ